MKKAIYIPILLLFLFFPVLAMAYETSLQDSTYIGPDETTNGTLYAAGSTMTVEGTVAGDLICAVETLNIKGRVEGSVICAARAINIDGVIDGNARIISESINVGGQISGNLNAFGSSIIIGSGANIGKDVLSAGESVEIRGKIGNDLYGTAGNLNISGEIGKDVKMRLSRTNQNPLSVGDQAVIGGNLFYTGLNRGSISDNADIGGEIGFTRIEAKKERSLFARSFGSIYSIFAALVIGLVLISLWRVRVKNITDLMMAQPGKLMLLGFAIMFLTPIISIFLIFTLIGLPLSLILTSVWLITIYIGKILAGVLVGRSIIEKLWPGNKNSIVWSMIIGIAIFWILGGLPVFGWAISLTGIWLGLGGLWLYIKNQSSAIV